AAGFCLIYSSVAMAGGQLPHNHAASHASSFETAAETAALDQHFHCPLNKHPFSLFCPHSQARKTADGQTQIGLDCGGGPAGKVPAKVGFDNGFNLANRFSPFNPIAESSPLVFSIRFHTAGFSDSLEHPPKYL
ncbi:MAG: hypothetical protein ACE5GQ_05075, partial [Nitrospinales bacterium]